MLMLNSLIKASASSLSKETSKDVAKSVGGSVINGLVKGSVNRIPIFSITKMSEDIPVTRIKNQDNTTPTTWNGEKDIESRIDGRFLKTNDNFFTDRFAQGSLDRANYAGRPYDQQKVAGLVRAIKNNEDIAPITAMTRSDNRQLEILDGHHRLSAYRKAGIMPRVKVVNNKSDGYKFAEDWATKDLDKISKYLDNL